MLKYVLFDLDGTLLDTTELILESYRHTIRAHLGFTPRDDQLLPGFGTPLYRQLSRFTGEGIEEMMVTYRAFNHANHDSMVRVFPGVKETLEALVERGFRLAIVTSKTRQISQVGLDLFGLSPSISFMVSMEDTDKHKPDPAPVVKALSLFGAQTEEAIYIGDSPHDMAAGHAAGVKTVAAMWGPFEKKALLAAEPDFTITSMPELLELIDRVRADSSQA